MPLTASHSQLFDTQTQVLRPYSDPLTSFPFFLECAVPTPGVPAGPADSAEQGADLRAGQHPDPGPTPTQRAQRQVHRQRPAATHAHPPLPHTPGPKPGIPAHSTTPQAPHTHPQSQRSCAHITCECGCHRLCCTACKQHASLQSCRLERSRCV